MWRSRQLGYIARIVLDDQRGVKVGDELFHPIVRSERGGPVPVERRHATALHLSVEMIFIAAEQHRPHFSEAHQQ